MEKTNEINQKLEGVLKRISETESEINTLKQNKIVIKYLDSLSLACKLKYQKEELEFQKMKNCNHYFVINAVDDEWDGHRTNYSNLATCIHCGLTNSISEEGMKWRGFPYDRMPDLIRNGAMNNPDQYHEYYDYNDIKELKELYDDFRSHNRDMSDKQIEKQIAKVKKPKSRFECFR